MKSSYIVLVALLAVSLLLVSCGVNETPSQNQSVYIIKTVNTSNTTPTPEITNVTPSNITSNATENVTSNATSNESVVVAPPAAGNMTIYFLDNLQGNAAYFEATNGKHVLIDGGQSSDDSPLIRWLMKMPGVIDNVLATDSNYYNLGGLDAVIYNFNSTHSYDSGFYEDYSGYKVFHDFSTYIAAGYTQVTADTEIKVDPAVKFAIFAPFEQGKFFNKTNDNALVVKISYNNVSVLFLGDCSEICQSALSNRDLKANVLRVYGGNVSQALVNEISPDVVITNSASNNGSTSFSSAKKVYTKNNADGVLTFVSDGTNYWIFQPVTANSSTNSSASS